MNRKLFTVGVSRCSLGLAEIPLEPPITVVRDCGKKIVSRRQQRRNPIRCIGFHLEAASGFEPEYGALQAPA